MAKARLSLIAGSGVDTERFTPAPEPEGVPVAMLVARMLWDKGVGEAVEAMRLLRARGVALRLWLAGTPDPDNPRSIAQGQLRQWQDEGLVEWLGQVDDVAALWHRAHIAVLPSYREGLPKSLLEAAASGRPMIATDAPGCRELVRDGSNGLLVPLRQAPPLADALERLATDPGLRAGAPRRDTTSRTITRTGWWSPPAWSCTAARWTIQRDKYPSRAGAAWSIWLTWSFILHRQ